jgi:hypothetical protein
LEGKPPPPPKHLTMTATSDIFEHRRRHANAEKGSQPGQVARLHPLDERLIDELAPRLADKLAPLLIERLADGLGLTPEQLRELGAPAREQSEAQPGGTSRMPLAYRGFPEQTSSAPPPCAWRVLYSRTCGTLASIWASAGDFCS